MARSREVESNPSAALRQLPAVHRVLEALAPLPLPRALVVDVVRRQLACARRAPGQQDPLQQIRAELASLQRQRIRPVINATGVVLHTNLGRAPLAASAVAALTQVAARYNTLEYDLRTGQRGQRGTYLERGLALLCQAPAATIVNNCAAALVLALKQFCRPRRREVLISRGELVQIGGGFRIPEILHASGARLREVGTTNRTTLADYHAAISPQTALILKVHQSNFRMEGFVEAPPTRALASLARKAGIPLVEDLGSGAVVPTEGLGLTEHEPTPAEVLAEDVDLVTFSGDKLLGGPQAGIIAGAAEHVAMIRKMPLFRAMRCDKLVMAALEATIDLYLDSRPDEVPAVHLLKLTPQALRARAQAILKLAGDPHDQVRLVPCCGEPGGGTLPCTRIPSVALQISAPGQRAEELLARLRAADPPVIGYIYAGAVMLDLRTVFPDQDNVLAAAIRHTLWAEP